MKTGEKKEGRGDTYLNKVGDAIRAAMPTLDMTDQHVAAAVYRLLSNGEPIDATAGAEPVGDITGDSVNERLNSRPGVFSADKGRVLGFCGHAIAKPDPQYRLLPGGTTT